MADIERLIALYRQSAAARAGAESDLFCEVCYVLCSAVGEKLTGDRAAEFLTRHVSMVAVGAWESAAVQMLPADWNWSVLSSKPGEAEANVRYTPTGRRFWSYGDHAGFALLACVCLAWLHELGCEPPALRGGDG
jgi:hypothetical protein